MNEPTVTISMKEYLKNQQLLQELRNESIEKFIEREYTSLKNNEYTVNLHMKKICEYLDEKYPDQEKIIHRSSSGDLLVKPKQPLLSITLQDESSVPTVIYKGEEIEGKQSIQLDWETSDAVSMGGLTYAIEHVERNKNYPAVNRIERRVKDHA